MDTETRFTLYEFKSRKKPVGSRHTYTWPELCEKFKNPIVTEESVDEYQAMTNEQKTDVKDVGGYVAGELKGGRRGKATLLNRQILTLDVDHADHGRKPLALMFTCSCLVHSTHSSMPEQPRYRWLFPLSRPVSAAEYRYLANKVAEWVGAETLDETTDQPERLMFWPSVSFDGEYYLNSNEEDPLLNPDDLLPDDLPEEAPAPTPPPVENGVLEIAEGQRNKTVFEFAATLRGKGLDPNGIREMLDQYNDRYCSPPLEGFELDTICRSVCSRYSPGDAVTNLRDAWDDFNDLGEWKDTKPAPVKSLSLESFRDLGQRRIDPMKPIVEGLIYPGLTLLVSPPKFGKSWMCLDLALSVAQGTDFLGMKTTKAGTLYLALEDSDRRLQDRSRKVMGGAPLPENSFRVTQAPTIEDGLLPMLHDVLEEHKDIRLVIIDTLQRVRGVAKRTEGAYGFDYRESGAFQKFAIDHDIALVLVHHFNKGDGGGDRANKISGTNGIFGAADTALLLDRGKRHDKETKLEIDSRDLPSKVLVLEFNTGTYRWSVLGEEQEVAERKEELEFNNDPLVKTIRDMLDRAEDDVRDTDATEVSWSCSSAEFLDEVERLYGSQGTSPDTVGRKLNTDAFAERLEKLCGITHVYERRGKAGRRTHVFTRDII